jgi:cytochrome c oxidase cbb3-type subunit 3
MSTRGAGVACRVAAAAGGLAALLALAGCEREARPFDRLAAASARAEAVAQTSLQAGGTTAAPSQTSPFQHNAWAQSEGKRLYVAYNCAGCHAMGGGAIGPPLMDGEWIYGFQPEQIYQTIVQGRPNGMPAFRGRIPDYQVWQIVAYVQSMSGQTPIDASPGRSDHLQTHQPEIVTPYQGRRQTGHK